MPDPDTGHEGIANLEDFIAAVADINRFVIVPDHITEMTDENRQEIESFSVGANGNVVTDGNYALNEVTNSTLAELGAHIKQVAAENGFDLTQLDDVRAAAAWDGDPSDLSDTEIGSLVAGYGFRHTNLPSSADTTTTLTNDFNFQAGIATEAGTNLAVQLGEQVYGDNNGNPFGVGLDTSALVDASNTHYEQVGETVPVRSNINFDFN